LYKRAYLYFGLAFAITLLGFWPSFFQNPAQNDLAHAIHGALATVWMLMLIAQSWLITHGQVAWHRRIGRASYVIFPAMVLSMTPMIRAMLTDKHGLPHDLALSLAALDIGSLILLAGFYGLAIAHRRKLALHMRYMSATVLIAVVPALGRVLAIYVPGVKGLAGALNPTFWIVAAAAGVLILDDRRIGRIYPPYPVTAAFMLIMSWAVWQAPHNPGFLALARWVAGT
jgi:hypothetical protein